jgi:nucleotide-binding universal stress UspA family protein
MKILLPVDGSEYSNRMIAYVAAQTGLFRDEHHYILFTVVPTIPLRSIDKQKYADLDEYCLGQANTVLGPLRSFSNQARGKVTEFYVYGDQSEEVVKYANYEKVDLIVMGSHGYSAVKNFILGSVTNGVIEGCSIPVLLIR